MEKLVQGAVLRPDPEHIIVYGMHACSTTRMALEALEKADVPYSFRFLGESVETMKEYLRMRENQPSFRVQRENDKVGIPTLVVGDEMTFDVHEAMAAFTGDASHLEAKAPQQVGEICGFDGNC